MKKRNPYIGKWRIIEMEMWDTDFINMETEGYFLFEKNQLGAFQFGLVQGRIDFRIESAGGIERIEFSWEGQDENDEAIGRGWALIKDDYLEGRIYFHLGDNSWFKATKIK
ncbi:MAG: hypothetical protein RBT74_17895 [Tenuifilaceae bacterium]|jgi:hypothetical protein|nr:hypothetical protein [Tenuifilaceae bacterium]